MSYKSKIIILYKNDEDLDKSVVNRFDDIYYENLIVSKIKIGSKLDYKQLHGTRVDGLYISDSLKDFIDKDDVLDVLEPMLGISIFNSRIRWF